MPIPAQRDQRVDASLSEEALHRRGASFSTFAGAIAVPLRRDTSVAGAMPNSPINAKFGFLVPYAAQVTRQYVIAGNNDFPRKGDNLHVGCKGLRLIHGRCIARIHDAREDFYPFAAETAVYQDPRMCW